MRSDWDMTEGHHMIHITFIKPTLVPRIETSGFASLLIYSGFSFNFISFVCILKICDAVTLHPDVLFHKHDHIKRVTWLSSSLGSLKIFQIRIKASGSSDLAANENYHGCFWCRTRTCSACVFPAVSCLLPNCETNLAWHQTSEVLIRTARWDWQHNVFHHKASSLPLFSYSLSLITTKSIFWFR